MLLAFFVELFHVEHYTFLIIYKIELHLFGFRIACKYDLKPFQKPGIKFAVPVLHFSLNKLT